MLKTILRAAVMVITASIGILASPTIVTQPNNSEAYVKEASIFVDQKDQPDFIIAEIKAEKDDRSKRLAEFLSSRGSPMASEANSLVKIADKYDLDWKLLPAIAGVESIWGTCVPTGSYNPYGWNNGSFYFGNWTAASEYVLNQIKSRWSYMGEITPWKIGPYYAGNPNWASEVNLYMTLIDNYK
ncbi:MAG TPA: hypothetical protein VF303_04715 [Candidatus Nanoarchaeia archaeon]